MWIYSQPHGNFLMRFRDERLAFLQETHELLGTEICYVLVGVLRLKMRQYTRSNAIASWCLKLTSYKLCSWHNQEENTLPWSQPCYCAERDVESAQMPLT